MLPCGGCSSTFSSAYDVLSKTLQKMRFTDHIDSIFPLLVTAYGTMLHAAQLPLSSLFISLCLWLGKPRKDRVEKSKRGERIFLGFSLLSKRFDTLFPGVWDQYKNS